MRGRVIWHRIMEPLSPTTHDHVAFGSLLSDEFDDSEGVVEHMWGSRQESSYAYVLWPRGTPAKVSIRTALSPTPPPPSSYVLTTFTQQKREFSSC